LAHAAPLVTEGTSQQAWLRTKSKPSELSYMKPMQEIGPGIPVAQSLGSSELSQ
jgi:hypothetical protein